jgi:acetoacetyl-CoA synthetase
MPTPVPLWQPSTEQRKRSQMYEFMTRTASRLGFKPEWEQLRHWAIESPDQFWGEFLSWSGVEPSTPAQAVMVGEGMLGTAWFPGLKLNYARHMLRFDDDSDAIIFLTERDVSGRISHRQLRAEVARCAAAMRAAGVKVGDRVAGFMPNIPETVIAMLAAASLGASWSSCSPDFGVRGVLDRFGQIAPTVLVACDGYTYGGKPFETLARVAEMRAQLPDLRKVVIVPVLHERPDLAGLPGAVLWRDFLGPAAEPAPGLVFEEVPFDHPLFIMYSSGTTGVPKCIVHGHGGTLLQHMKELMLHCDLRAGERIFYFTTCGWMMWNWLVSGLGVGAAVVLYEGNPGHPTMDCLWQMSEDLDLHVFGTRARSTTCRRCAASAPPARRSAPSFSSGPTRTSNAT